MLNKHFQTILRSKERDYSPPKSLAILRAFISKGVVTKFVSAPPIVTVTLQALSSPEMKPLAILGSGVFSWSRN